MPGPRGKSPLSREIVAASGLAVATLLLMMPMPDLTRTLAGKLALMLQSPAKTPAEALWAAALLCLAPSFRSRSPSPRLPAPPSCCRLAGC